jgi:hypothetical protein
MNTILSYLAAVAAEFASIRIRLTSGSYGGYMESPTCQVETLDVSDIWDNWGDFANTVPDEQPTSLIEYAKNISCFLGNGIKYICYSECPYDRKDTVFRTLDQLPSVDSKEALSLLVNWMGNQLNGMIDDGGCSLETEAAYEKREAEKRFKRLEGIAREVLKSNPGESLFDVLTGMRAAAEDRIYGLQEDGLCATGGFGQAALNDWYDLRNHYCGQAQEAMELFDFCTCHYPLTYLAWQEAKAENVNA